VPLTRVEPRGLEPLTPCLQSKCATCCAMAPRSLLALVGGALAARGETRIKRPSPRCICTVCAIRLVAPSTAFCVMVPTGWPEDIAGDRARRVPIGVEATALSAPLRTPSSRGPAPVRGSRCRCRS
jgi:hypothetical protein